MNNSDCIICDAPIIYYDKSKKLKCEICQQEFETNATCEKLHFICDNCHKSTGVDFIQKLCLNTKEINAIVIAEQIMKHKSFKMHGPEHHFLVPAIMITSYYNYINKPELINNALIEAKKRSSNVLGGFCGFYGSCGAGVGNGIFLSIILNCTPMSKEEYKFVNMITGKTLVNIANKGGPRCCKRNTFTAIETLIDFLDEEFDVKLPKSKIKCRFSSFNKECKLDECDYFYG